MTMTQIPQDVLQKLHPQALDALMQEAYEKAKMRAGAKSVANRYTQYANDPVRFGNEVLKASFHEEIRQVMESVRDNQITIARSGNALGKSHSAAHIAVWWYKCHEGAQVYTTAAPPFENLRKILWGELLSLNDRCPDVFRDDLVSSMEIKRAKQENYSRDKQEFITGVAIPTTGTAEQRESKFSGKHSPYILFIVDEGDAVPDEVYKGIQSCMSGGIARLLVMFNPRARTGAVWTMERDRRANVIILSAFNHPNVLQKKNVIPGAVSYEVTVQRVNEWTRPLIEGEKAPEDKTFTLPEHLIGSAVKATNGRMYEPLTNAIRVITEPQFSYMVLGEYPAQGSSQLISQSWINRARANWDMWVAKYGETPPRGIHPILGCDIAEFGVDYNTAAFRYGSYLDRVIIWSGVDVFDTAMRIFGLSIEKGAKTVLVDGSGVGTSVAPFIARVSKEKEKDIRAFGVKVANSPMTFIRSEQGEFWQLRDQLWWAMREWLRTDPNAMLPPDDMLLEELTIPTYRYQNGKIKIMEKDEMRSIIRRSPDRAEAVMLTFHPQKRAKVMGMSEGEDN